MSRTLVIGLNWLGDAVMSFPAITAAAQAANGPLDVLTRPHLADLYARHPHVGHVWTLDSRRLVPSGLPILRRLGRCRYETILVLPRSLRAAVMAWIIGGRTRIGYAGEWRSIFLHPAVPWPQNVDRRHESQLYLQLAHFPASAPSSSGPGVHGPLKSLAASERESILAVFGLLDRRPFWVVAPGAAFGPVKRWPPERFAELSRLIIAENQEWVVATGSQAEQVLTASVAAACGTRGLDLAGRTSLRELIAIIEASAGVIANDSGTMHLAALCGKPVVVPIGSTDPVRTGPMGEKVRLVSGTSCCRPPCRRQVCRLGDNRCMTSIAVADMWQAFRQVARP